jgi:hypothetical protein
MPQRITGSITRLVAGDAGEPDRIFMQPDAHVDMRFVDGHHRRASGEIAVEGALEGRKVGDVIELELDDNPDPLLTRLTIVG